MNYNTILPPFKWFVLQNFPYIEDDFDALTNWQLFCKLGKEMNKIIEKCNLTGEQVENLTNAYNELKAYVDDYFENLDIQEEVNAKLDEMAQSGELADIIAQFLNANCILKFDTLEQLENSTNVIEGNIVAVFGKTSLNDGFVNYYTITTEETNIPLQNNLYAKIIYDEKVDGSYLIDEIEQHELYVENSKSTVQIFKIPNKDKFNKPIEMKHGFSDDIISDTPATETPTHFSNRKNATLCANASIGCVNTESVWYGKIMGLIIHDGVVVTDSRQYYDSPGWYAPRYILGLKSNGLLEAYVGNLPAQTLLDDGVVESWQGFIPVMVNGENNRDNLIHTHDWEEPIYSQTSDVSPVAYKIYYVLDDGEYIGQYNIPAFEPGITYYEQTNTNGRYSRQIIAQNGTTKDFYILTSNGKGKTSNLGITYEEVITLLKYVDPGVTFAYLLDQGGSTATAYMNINRVHPTDNPNTYTRQTNGVGRTERKVCDFIYFSKETETQKDIDINYLLHEIQDLKDNCRALQMSNELNNVIRSGNGVSVENWDENAPNNLFFAFKQLQQDGTLKTINSITSNPSSAPGSINFYDNENSRGFFRFNRDGTTVVNEGDTYGAMELANIFTKVKTITDCNSLTKTGIFFCLGNATGAPFHDVDYRGNVILNVKMAEDASVGAQVGFFVGGNPTQIAYRCLIQGTVWTAWKYCNIA